MNNILVRWECPSNIALIKYWGKRQGQTPMNPSLSFGLEKSRTRTSVRLLPAGLEKVDFLFGGERSVFSKRIEEYLLVLSERQMPWIKDYSFHIESDNTFPHSAGIASSASAFGALALCMVEIDGLVTGKASRRDVGGEQFLREASYVARLGSGSACRSVFAGFAWWGRAEDVAGSSDLYAAPVGESFHPSYGRLRDAILLVDAAVKKVSSAAGHHLMKNHPYRSGRIRQANVNARLLLELLRTGDHPRFFETIESEALSLHGLMMSSSRPFQLMKPATLAVIDKIRSFREQAGIALGFTMDAGANVHLLYLADDHDLVAGFINTDLKGLLAGGMWIDDGMGAGPSKLT